MHFCGDTLIDAAVLSEVKGCGVALNTALTSPMKESCSMTKKSCCSDRYISVEGQNELKVTYSDFNLEQQLFFTAFLYSYKNLFKELPFKATFFKDYSPPTIRNYIYKLDESYLI